MLGTAVLPELPGIGGLAVIRELRPTDPMLVGPYRMLGRLGAGGMGQVYLARSQGGRLIAVKVIRPELAEERGFRARFASEIAAARNVSGMYTAAVIDSDPEAELPWMATAYVPGPSLAEAVDDDGPLPVKSVLALAAGLAEALAAIHRAGVVHRDLNPSNVLLAADGPRVIDFGISQTIDRSVLTATGAVLGSPGFMSPEQARGQREVGQPTDVFSLGAVLAFAATGIGPFGSGGIPALLYRVVNEEPELAQVPVRLRPLIERCLAKDPASRPAPAEVLGLLGDEADLPTGEWLPKTIADTINRFNPEIEGLTPAPAVPELPAPEEPFGRADPDVGISEPATLQSAPGAFIKQELFRPAESLRDVQANIGAAAGNVVKWAATPTALPSTTQRKGGRVKLKKAGGDGRLQPSAGGGRRSRAWRAPASAAAAAIAIAVPAAILVASPGDTSGKSPPRPVPSLARTTTAPASSAYASASLVTGSSSMTAWVYFGQLKAIVNALAGQVTLTHPPTGSTENLVGALLRWYSKELLSRQALSTRRGFIRVG